jgi:PIN like domain
VLNVLNKAGVRHRIYRQDVKANAGSEDVEFLPKVGNRGWLLITADWHQRTRPREVADLKRFGVKHFALPGNLGAVAMAELLALARNNIRACARDHEGYVSTTVMRSGAVNVLRDERGSLHERGEKKTYFNGKVRTTIPVLIWNAGNEMKPLPAPDVPGATEFERFDNAIRQILRVPKTALPSVKSQHRKPKTKKTPRKP